MAFDGITINNLVYDFKNKLIGGRIQKISQPESDELLLTIKNYDIFKLHISVNPSLPLIYLTTENKPAPLTAPGFCMLLRKHLNSARIIDILQPDMERVIQFKIEHLDELGDLKIKWLIIEIMGKHSNIIFTDENFTILDSIKRISAAVSSVREVLPGRSYFIPKSEDKSDIRNITLSSFKSDIKRKSLPLTKAIYTSYNGISPIFANELIYRAKLDGDMISSELSENDLEILYCIVSDFIRDLEEGKFTPTYTAKDGKPIEFSPFTLELYNSPEYTNNAADDISSLIIKYYADKENSSRISQKSFNLRKSLQTAIERVVKKLELQEKQLKSTEKREQYKIYGEMITTYGYGVEEGSKSFTCVNYYDNEEITIPLDDSIPVMSNAKKYFDKYSKLKRTYEAVTTQLEASNEELYHLRSIQNALNIAETEADLASIKKELSDFGYTKKEVAKNSKKQPKIKLSTKPIHYQTPDGFDIYIGRNNFQNDELTFSFADNSDWWFHAKKMPGSHVIVKSKGLKELPDSVYEYAANAAAYYSTGRDNNKVEVDYLIKKNVKKPNNAKPGFVVYYTNFSMIALASIDGLKLIED